MMKTTFKIFAFVLGLSSLLLGANSCKKDPVQSCCTWRYDGSNYKYCEGGSYDGRSLTGATWTYYKNVWRSEYGATCN